LVVTAVIWWNPIVQHRTEVSGLGKQSIWGLPSGVKH
jgi:hypothetical protein